MKFLSLLLLLTIGCSQDYVDKDKKQIESLTKVCLESCNKGIQNLEIAWHSIKCICK